MQISVVVPNFNHGDRLPAAIAALLGQSRPPDEIIIVDDGSTDASRDVIDGLARNDNRICVAIHSENRGAVAAMNTGLEMVTGSHVALVAADDLTRENLFERLAEALTSAPDAAFASAEVALADRNGTVRGIRPPARPSQVARYHGADEVRRFLRGMDNFVLTGAALFRSDLLLAAGPLREDLGSFADGFMVRKLALRHGFVFVPEVLAEWRVDPGGFSRATASDPARADALLHAAMSAITADSDFPSGYAARFADRWRFGVLRLALEGEGSSPMIAHYAPGPRAARGMFCQLARGGAVARLTANVWMTMAYRPTSFVRLLKTLMIRRRSVRQVI